DHLGKFDGKADEGYIVGYSASNRAYRVYNVPNKRVEETMNLRYLEEKPNVQGLGHEWYFDLDYLTDTLGYKRDKANQSAGTQEASTNPAGTQDADSDSECDDNDDSPLDSAEEIFQQELENERSVTKSHLDAKDAENFHERRKDKNCPYWIRNQQLGGCQFLGRRLISWQCKKQTIVATSSTKAEYVVVANCCGQFILIVHSEALIRWSALAGWEVISTPLGEINALYSCYGYGGPYYGKHLLVGGVGVHGLMLWGDLQVLIDSQEGGKGSSVWNHQSLWQIRSWRLYTLSNVHVLETVSGEFNKFLEGVLMKNKDDASSRDIQLICVLNFQVLSTIKESSSLDVAAKLYFNLKYVVPTGRVVVPTGRYVVPAGKVIIIVSPGRLSLVPTGRVLSPGRVK
ncbi:hypothetical protein Tco_1307462, partial [Tanacetum coccineum]